MPQVWDAIIVGAGPSGAAAAEGLRACGHAVLLLDAGPFPPNPQKPPEVDRRAWPFSASGGSFDWYRIRAVGGRALLWGGWCHRFPTSAFHRAKWPIDPHVMTSYYDEAERLVSIVHGELDARYERVGRALGVSIVPKNGAAQRLGNIWSPLATQSGQRTRVNTIALHLEHERGHAEWLATLDLRSDNVRRLRARAFILAASPFETARILLLSELGEPGRRIGRSWVDHMVASYLLLEPRAAPTAEARGSFPGCALVENFVNISGTSERLYRGGFSIELRGPVTLPSLGIERMVGSDDVDRYSATLIHAMGETFPSAKRFMDLDATKRDLSGRPVPDIHVAWTQEDHAMAADMKNACERLADALAVPGSRLIPFVDPLLAGAGHEAGTCAMGRDDDSPADPDARVRGLDNVWVADASAMPTAGDRHPTLTLLAHALRVSDSVSRYLNDTTGRPMPARLTSTTRRRARQGLARPPGVAQQPSLTRRRSP